jgi:hypothetical protein
LGEHRVSIAAGLVGGYLGAKKTDVGVLRKLLAVAALGKESVPAIG